MAIGGRNVERPMACNHFQVSGLIIIPGTLKKYVRDSMIIFGELALFLGNGSMYQKQILLMEDKHEAKFITVLLLLIIKYLVPLCFLSDNIETT